MGMRFASPSIRQNPSSETACTKSVCGNKKPVIADSRLWYKTLHVGVDSTSSLVNLNIIGCVLLLVHNARWGSSLGTGRRHHVRLVAGREGPVAAHRLGERMCFSPHLHSEHNVRTRVSRVHEDPEALAGETVKDDARIAGLEQHGVADQRDPASRFSSRSR
jgi:hypothetical protein